MASRVPLRCLGVAILRLGAKCADIGPIRVSACTGTHTHVHPSVLGMPQSWPPCWPAAEVAASPRHRDTQRARTLRRGLHLRPGRRVSTDTFSQLRLQCVIEDQVPPWPRRQGQQPRAQEASSSRIPAPRCPLTSRACEGRGRGQEGKTGREMPRLRMGQLLFKQPALPQITRTLAVLLEESTSRKEQRTQAGVLGDAPSSDYREERKPSSGQAWAGGHRGAWGQF